MTDRPSPATGGDPSPVHDLVVQLRVLTDRLAAVSGLTRLTGLVGSLPGVADLPSLPRPGSLSMAELRAVVSTVAAQRRSIEAMTTQLVAFADQLAVMEQILEPVLEWTTAWADLEAAVLGHASTPDE